EPRQHLLGHETLGERLDARDGQLVEIGLVLFRRVPAVLRQITQPEREICDYLARALMTALQQVAPEPPFGATFDEGSVDVEDSERHCRLPGLLKISLFCARTNSAITGRPRAIHSSTDR